MNSVNSILCRSIYTKIFTHSKCQIEVKIRCIKQLTSNIPKEAFKTFTSDRGKEFSCWKKVEEMGIDFYFADPYCSWQRGCNENSNGLLREF